MKQCNPQNLPQNQENPRRILLANLAETERLGQSLAFALRPGLVVYLEGDLGAGKTSLTRALLFARGHRGAVKSPTYSLVEVYVVSRLYFYHFDFYRFSSPEEFFDAGLDEYFREDAICLAEWPEKAVGAVPAADLRLCFAFVYTNPGTTTADARTVTLTASSQKGAECLKKCLSVWDAGISALAWALPD